MPDSASLRLELVFKLRNEAAFEQCLASLSNPTSPNYRHFLNPNTLEPYVPTPGQKESVANFLKKQGFTVTNGPSPIVLELTGTVGTITRTFGTRLSLYLQGSNSFFSTDSDPRMPQSLGTLVTAITGLDNFTVIRPAEFPCGSSGWPDCPKGVQVGYGLSNLYSLGHDGTGQTVAVVDMPGDPNIQTAMNRYNGNYSYALPNTVLSIVYPEGPPSTYDPAWAAESAMDVEAVHSAAPGAKIVLLYNSNTDPDLMNAVDYVASQNLAQIVSNSWSYACTSGPCSDTQLTPGLVSSVDDRLAIDSAMGLTILFASGDQGAKPDGSNLGTEFPASDPNVLAVGATDLTLVGCGPITCSAYGSEAGASISGGGYSGNFTEPSWQISAIGTQPGRAVPDVSMLGNSPDFWVYSTLANACSGGSGGGWFGCAGTSLSTPLWGGFLAVVLQIRGGGYLGNVAPLLYQLAHSSSYSFDFHDVTTGSNGMYSAGIGWDPVTGLGTPIADQLALDLSPVSVSTDKTTYTHGTDSVNFTGSGLTSGGSVYACISTDNDGSVLCLPTTNADSFGNVAGSMQIGNNVPAGPQKFLIKDIATGRFSNQVQLTILGTPTIITLSLAPNSIGLGSSLVLSGSITPNPGSVQVAVSTSRDSGSTWTTLMLIMTNSSGTYSTSWIPPYSGSYLLKSSWSGDSQYAGSTSSAASLTVTETPVQNPTLLLSAPATASAKPIDSTIDHCV